MRAAIWLYMFIFIAFFDLHAQYPILTPFALSLGAAPSFIGIIMGMYSLTHLPGNLLAGYGVDRFGSKPFISFSLIVAGILLLFQAQIQDPWQLLLIRSISGFVLAFLSPACLALLAKMARDHIHQGKLMAGNGLVHTLASVVSPAAGAVLVAKIGFSSSFSILGILLIVTGVLAIFGVKEVQSPSFTQDETLKEQLIISLDDQQETKIPWLFFAVPLAISCSQGILFFELPLMEISLNSILSSGILFSIVSLGALVTLGMLFINKYSSLARTAIGALGLAFVFYGMAIDWPIALPVALFMIGMAKGVILPAISTLLASITAASKYGRVFSIMSIAYSIGAFLGPLLAGQFRDSISSYFIAFAVLMIGLSCMPINTSKNNINFTESA